MQNSPTLSLAGTWVPVDSNYLVSNKNYGGLAQTTYGHLALNGREGLVISGWGWTGGFGDNAALKSPETVHVALLEQQGDGTLRLATTKYLASDVINGANSVVISDFNGDGFSDIFLPAHNESPFVALPSTIYLSNVQGRFDKMLLTDRVMAHETILISMNGVPAVLSATFSPGDAHPIYTFSGGNVQKTIPKNLASVFYMSMALGDFGANGTTALVLGDVYNSTPGENFKINIYPFANGDITTTTPIATITPYLSAKYPEYASHYGTGITHTYRLYSDDFNHDGKTDIIAEQSMWNSSGTHPSALQMLQNQGNWSFVDKTDQLAGAVSQNSNELDYQTQLVDLDHSGINSYLMGGGPTGNFVNGQLIYDNARAANYVLLNDGTGQLHVGLGKQFLDWGAQVVQYANGLESNSNGVQNFYVGDNLTLAGVPKFKAYQVGDGSINFVAELQVGRWASKDVWQVEYLFVNVPVRYNPTTDYTDPITITDRNGSHLIRTFAGNDIIKSGGSGGYCSINGGLGIDTVVYARKSADYSIKLDTNKSYSIKDNIGSDGIDTVANIERLQFTDKTLAFDLDGNAGQAYRLYQAAFDRVPDRAGLGDWIDGMDRGMGLSQVATGFINSAEFKSLYGNNPSNAEFVTLLYDNVLHRAPDTAGYDYWMSGLSSGMTREQALIGFSESTENKVALMAFDMNGNMGQVYRLYQAAFDRTPDVGGVGNWTQGMNNGMTLQQVASGFINSAEFKALYGSNPTNAEFVTLLYDNVLHRAPDTAGYNDWMKGLAQGMSRADMLIGFSESLENQLSLVGIVQTGIEFI